MSRSTSARLLALGLQGGPARLWLAPSMVGEKAACCALAVPAKPLGTQRADGAQRGVPRPFRSRILPRARSSWRRKSPRGAPRAPPAGGPAPGAPPERRLARGRGSGTALAVPLASGPLARGADGGLFSIASTRP